MANDRLIAGNLAPIQVLVAPGSFLIRLYSDEDPIWKLEREKRERKAVADFYRDMIKWRDDKAAEPVTVRG